ncbi:integrase catalytic domain-containing protein [Nephila pilipes]|uniref:Integrase catalytic domain-containing protein n=1 Tax=Nephila pilipes TaxID=299642 RepID=A0A8X6TSL1_NEPPI|nr:integrase catalytic domain-containing protein [Nephila pilipes]
MEEHKLKGRIIISYVLNSLRERFWILAGRRVVSSVLKTCITCKRYSNKNVNPSVPPFPEDRGQDASVFQITSIDYAGSIFLREYKKAWICLFTTRKQELRGWEYSDPTDNSSSTTNVLGMVWERCGDYLCPNITNITYVLPEILFKRDNSNSYSK